MLFHFKSTLIRIFKDIYFKSIIRLLLSLFIVLSLISLLVDILYNISVLLSSSPSDFWSNMNNIPGSSQGGISNPNNPQDPVRWWPSGVPQTWTIIGSSLAVYRFLPGSPRVRAIAALGTLSVTIPSVVLINAIENPNGFNRLMFSWMHHRATGRWPATIPTTVTDGQLEPVVENMQREATANAISNNPELQNNNVVDNVSNLPGDGNNPFNFIRDGDILSKISDYFNNISLETSPTYNKFINIIYSIFRPVNVEGYFDDLIGQQLLIIMSLFVIAVGLLLLMVAFLIIVFMLQNKDFILKKFNNKLIKFYINYQVILAKIGIYVLPLFILFGLIELIFFLYYLLTHTLPYESLPIDLHIYVSASGKQ